jgi:hypothetical protein
VPDGFKLLHPEDGGGEVPAGPQQQATTQDAEDSEPDGRGTGWPSPSARWVDAAEFGRG